MSNKINGTNGLTKITKPLVDAGLYDSTESVLEDLIEHVVKEKIEDYNRKINKSKELHGSFDEFSKKIKEKATEKEEDEWMEWEASRNMLKQWKKVAKEIDVDVSIT